MRATHSRNSSGSSAGSSMSGSTRNGGGHARGSSQSQRRRQPSTWVFYVVQGGVHGDNADTPNAFKVMKHVSELRLEDVRDAFPLTRRTGARFHFRFKVAAGGEVRSRAGGNASGDYCYMDLVNPADNVPTFEGHVHIKALQLDTLRCVTQRTNRFLRPRATAAAQRAAAAKARATPTATGDTATAPRPAASGPRRSPPASPARATQGSDGAQPPPVPGRKRSGKARNRPRRVAPDQSSLRRAQSASPRQQHVASNTTPAPAPARASTPGAGELRPTPRAAAAAAPSPSPAASGSSTPVTAQPAVASAPAPDAPPPAGVPVPEHVVESGPVVMPDHIDEDLRNSGKSDFVIAGIQRRRDAAAASHAARLKAIADREAAAKQAEAARHTAQQTLGAKLDAWRLDSNGQLNNIRVLLCTLDTVLWEGAKWKAVKMGELVNDRKVHMKYLRACAVVHPDKNTKEQGAAFERQYIAERVFEALNEAHKSA